MPEMDRVGLIVVYGLGINYFWEILKNGFSVSALVTLSVDRSHGSQKPLATTRQSSQVQDGLPASYGRALPISEEEISAVNVSVLGL
jgi:hypothetical protein